MESCLLASMDRLNTVCIYKASVMATGVLMK